MTHSKFGNAPRKLFVMLLRRGIWNTAILLQLELPTSVTQPLFGMKIRACRTITPSSGRIHAPRISAIHWLLRGVRTVSGGKLDYLWRLISLVRKLCGCLIMCHTYGKQLNRVKHFLVPSTVGSSGG